MKVRFNNSKDYTGGKAQVIRKMAEDYDMEGIMFASLALCWMDHNETESCHVTFDPDTKSIGISNDSQIPAPPSAELLQPQELTQEIIDSWGSHGDECPACASGTDCCGN